MIGLWDTTGDEVVKALAAERRSAGGVTSGLVLTLIVIVDERRVREAEAAATIAAAAHPCRLLIVVRSEVERELDRLDAEIVVGGRLGPCEAVVMRMYGQLALHAESVVVPLLAPDVPVVTWWHKQAPERIAQDYLGVVADRRVTDAAEAADPLAALVTRAEDYRPGDTDLTWTRITLWRSLVASAFDTVECPVNSATIEAPSADPTAALMSGWLTARLGVTPALKATTKHPRMRSLSLKCAKGQSLELIRSDNAALMRRSGARDRHLPLLRRTLGEELAEELRRLDADPVYAEALSAYTGVTDLGGDGHADQQRIWLEAGAGTAATPDAAAAASGTGTAAPETGEAATPAAAGPATDAPGAGG